LADERRVGFSFGAALRAARRPDIAERRASITPARAPRAPQISVGARLEQRLGAAGARAFLSRAAPEARTVVAAAPVSPPTSGLAQAPSAAVAATVPESIARVAQSPTATDSGAPARQGSPTPAGGIKTGAERGSAGESEPVETTVATPNLHAAVAPLAQALHQRARTARHHKLGKHESVQAAQDAAKVPHTEQVRIAATKTVDQLNDADTKPFDRAALRARLTDTINEQMTHARSKEEAEDVMNRGAAKASATLNQDLKQQRDAAAGGLPAATDPRHDVAPDKQSVPDAVELRPEAAGPTLATVDSTAAVPAPLPGQQLDFSADRAPTDQAMAENQVTTEQMQEGNDPAFGPVLSERATAERHEAEAAGTYRVGEAKIRTDALTRAQVAVRAGLSGMHGVRERELGGVAAQQHGVRAADSLKRTQIMTRISQIKSETQSAVKGILDEMDREASRIFTDGLQRASERYEDAFSDVKGGAKNWLLNWGDDWKELIERALASARGLYRVLVYNSIDEVANYVERQIKAAKERAAIGQRQAIEVVDSLGGEMSDFADQARAAIATDFGALQSQIDERCEALINRLSEQLKASYDKMKAREEALREANKSLWERVYDATVGAIKKIIEFKNLLFSVLAKAASVVLDIIAHPIRFLGNLVEAVGQGLRNFVKNIGTHLEKGLMDWLFGALAGAGLKLPEKFDLEGIVSIVLQILGLTYDKFRARAVNLLGESIVAALEKGAEVFMIFMREGVAGIWRFIKEKVSELKSMVLDAIFDFIKEKVITAGITWIIGLLNPASAFFKACKAIYDIIVFIVNRATQIVTFVSAVVDSIAEIVAGNISSAAAAVENALARAIPVAIGFLASLLGLGDPSKPVKQTIEKAQSPINNAIDWVINGAVKLVKASGKLIGGAFGKGDKDKATAHEDDPQKAAKIEAGLAALHTEEKALSEGGTELTQKRAEAVAAKVHAKHRVFMTLVVVPAGEHWAYEYTASERRRETSSLHRLDKEQIFRMVQDLARVRFARALERVEDKRSAGESTLAVKPGDAPHDLGAAIRTRPESEVKKRGSSIELQIGDTKVFARQGTGAANVIVAGLGKYPEIAAALRAKGWDGPMVYNQVVAALRTGTGDIMIMRLIALMSGAEVSRLDEPTVTGPLTLISMGEGRSPEAALVEGFPEAPRGARRAEERASQIVAGKEFETGTKIQMSGEEYIRRIVELTFVAVKDDNVKSVDQLRAKIVEALERFEKQAGFSS
jgi:hypothetical protein